MAHMSTSSLEFQSHEDNGDEPVKQKASVCQSFIKSMISVGFSTAALRPVHELRRPRPQHVVPDHYGLRGGKIQKSGPNTHTHI